MALQKREIVLFDDKIDQGEHIEALNKYEPLVIVKKASKQEVVPASEASPVLCKARGVWPFDFYPDEVIIEEKRLILKRKTFPFFTTITTIPINKIITFDVSHSIFFSSLHVRWGYNMEETYSWLKKNEAHEAKEIMDGIRMRDNEFMTVLEQDRVQMAHTFQAMGQM